MADTFKLSGTLAAGAYTTITPPGGELWIIGPGSFVSSESTGAFAGGHSNGYGAAKLHPASSPHKLFVPVASGTPSSTSGFASGGGNPERLFSIVNTSGVSASYFITGDITTMASEGIDEVWGSAVQNGAAGNTWDGFTPVAGKALLVVLAGCDGASNTLQILDSGTNAVLLSDLNVKYPSNTKFWLWSDLGVKIRFNTVGGSAGSAYARVTRYKEDSALDEYGNRVAVKQSIAAGASYDLRPAQGELIYVDLHNWFGAGRNLYWNGGGTLEGTSPPRSTMRLSYDNWVRFTNGGGSAATLLISGTKASVV